MSGLVNTALTIGAAASFVASALMLRSRARALNHILHDHGPWLSGDHATDSTTVPQDSLWQPDPPPAACPAGPTDVLERTPVHSSTSALSGEGA